MQARSNDQRPSQVGETAGAAGASAVGAARLRIGIGPSGALWHGWGFRTCFPDSEYVECWQTVWTALCALWQTDSRYSRLGRECSGDCFSCLCIRLRWVNYIGWARMPPFRVHSDLLPQMSEKKSAFIVRFRGQVPVRKSITGSQGARRGLTMNAPEGTIDHRVYTEAPTQRFGFCPGSWPGPQIA